MKRASRLLSSAERERVERAVAEAERRTAAEIVPVIATASGRYDRAEDLCGVVVALLSLALAWPVLQGSAIVEGDWGPTLRPGLGLLPALAVVLGGFLVGAVLATFFPVLRLPFVSAREMDEEVDRAASAAFHRFRIRGTAAGTGLLLYVSLFERRVRVLADETAAVQLQPRHLEELCQIVVSALRDGRAADGLVRAAERAAELLAEGLPAADDGDQLPNSLVLLD